MKRCFSLVTLIVFSIGLLSLLAVAAVTETYAQIDGFTFFIPYPADLLDDQFDLGNNNNFQDVDIVTSLSMAVVRDGTIIYYDHWEDGLEPHLTSPGQTSTQVWGDANPNNGIPPGFTTDLLKAGDVLRLQSKITLPRDPTNLFFDGGDKLIAVGGTLSIGVANWPENPATLYAGAWALYPTSRWGKEFVIPVGENLGGVGPGLRVGFRKVLVNVQAASDGTTVELDLNADGNLEQTLVLDEGEQFTQISGVTNSGGLIRASGPVQVHLLTANPQANYEARAYTLIPRDQWTADLIGPRGSGGDFWLYNPDTQPLMVTARTVSTTTTLLIPPQTTAQYNGHGGAATGLHFTSTDGRPFYGLAALAPDSAQDWGYTLLPVANITSQKLVGWAPGNVNQPPDGDESRLYISAITTMTLLVDYNHNNQVDATLVITPLAEISIIDPNDFDLTGAYLFSADGTPFATVWGQRPDAPVALPSIDVGLALVPLPSLQLQKTIRLSIDADQSGTISWGDTLRFIIFNINNSQQILDPTVVSDTLPLNITYISNSTTVRGQPIPDDSSGATAFPLDEGGYVIPGGLGAREAITTAFESMVNENATEVCNTARLESPPAPPPKDPGTTCVPAQTARYELGKRLTPPTAGCFEVGNIISYDLTLTSTGNISLTTLPLADNYNSAELSYLDAVPPPDVVADGLLSWTDLATTTLFGPLPPNRVISLSVRFTVNDTAAPTTLNRAAVQGAKGIDGSHLPPVDAEATAALCPPPTPTPDSNDDDDDASPPTLTPTPLVTPTTTSPTHTPPPDAILTPTPLLGTPNAQGTPALPVALLPETGDWSVEGETGRMTLLGLVFGMVFSLGLWVVHKSRKNT